MARAGAAWIALAVLGACGRVHFESPSDAGTDAAMDATVAPPPDTGTPDAGPGYCDPLGETVPATCSAALVDPEPISNTDLYNCGRACMLGACQIYDRSDCPACACNAYVKTSELCTPEGSCVAPLDGTGCLGAGYYNRPPFNCPAGAIDEAACMLRGLIREGYCDGV